MDWVDFYVRLRENRVEISGDTSDSLWFVIIIFYFSLGIFAIVCCLFIILVFFVKRDSRVFTHELFCFLSVPIIITNISYMINILELDAPGPPRDDFYCNFQAAMITFSEMSQFIWTALYGFFIYFNIVLYGKENPDNEPYYIKNKVIKRLFLMLLGYGIPLITAISLIFLDVYGKSGHWCWLANKDYYNSPTKNTSNSYDNLQLIPNELYEPAPKGIENVDTVSIIYYSVVWLLMLLNFIFVSITINFLKRDKLSSEENTLVNKYIYRLLQFPLIQLVIVFPQTLAKFLSSMGYADAVYANITVCLLVVQGIFYTMSYGLNNQIKKDIKELLCLCFCCKKVEVESSDVESLDNRSLGRSDSNNSINNSIENFEKNEELIRQKL